MGRALLLGKELKLTGPEQPREPITVTLPDGKEVSGTSWETTPMEVARGISTSLADRVIIAKVNNQELWDLNRPLEASCSLALLDFDSPDNNYEARQVFWHSSAHVMGEACERSFSDCCLGYGPPLAEGGFFYDMALGEGRTVSLEDYAGLEEVARKAVKEKQAFERLELPKEVLKQMFKVCTMTRGGTLELTAAVQQVQTTLHRRQGARRNFIHGLSMRSAYRPMSWSPRPSHRPHKIPRHHQSKLTVARPAYKLNMKNSSSYFLGDAKNDTFQRVYGMSFPDSKQMTEYKKYLEEAAKRDHRTIGKQQELWFFHELSPGSVFMLPMGTRIYNTLKQFITVCDILGAYMGLAE